MRYTARMSGPALYSPGEEIANSITHGLGWLASVGGLVTLVKLASLTGGALRVVSCAVFGTTLVLLYAASTLYHALPGERAKRVFRVLDHSAIFLLIAGTYTPLALIALGGGWGWALFGCVWFLAVVGVLVNALAPGRWRGLSMVLYLAMGWSVVVAIKPLKAALAAPALMLVVIGGLAYTGGLAFYAWRRLPYSHAIWHVFVLAGSALHFVAVLIAVGRPA